MSRLGECRKCEHSRLIVQLGTKALFCARHPPRPQMVPFGQGNVSLEGLFPPVAPDTNCGEFKAYDILDARPAKSAGEVLYDGR